MPGPKPNTTPKTTKIATPDHTRTFVGPDKPPPEPKPVKITPAKK